VHLADGMLHSRSRPHRAPEPADPGRPERRRRPARPETAPTVGKVA
jgi:hypothetical protein